MDKATQIFPHTLHTQQFTTKAMFYAVYHTNLRKKLTRVRTFSHLTHAVLTVMTHCRLLTIQSRVIDYCVEMLREIYSLKRRNHETIIHSQIHFLHS